MVPALLAVAVVIVVGDGDAGSHDRCRRCEAVRRDGKPEWMQVAGLIRDLVKPLFFFGSNGQWGVVGVSILRVYP